MGKIVNNNITSSFSGQFGDELIFRQVGNRTFFAKKGIISKPPTAAQLRNRALFAAAQNYASQIIENPESSERYSIMAKVNGMKAAQIAAVKDYMSKPEIDSVNTRGYKGNIGDVIHIKPKMLLKIKRIEITIYQADGSELESGLAIKNELNWKYSTTVFNPHLSSSRIVMIAYDSLGKSCTVVTHLYS